MPGNLPGEVTQLIGEGDGGDRAALDKVMPLVYDELRRLAHRQMARDRAGHTLQATKLVDEVYLKFRDARAGVCQNRAQFFAVAARMMRHILVDYARRHTRPNAAAASNE
jgi:RNA polymerase sigma factor (TIGR02999 family)